MNVFNGFGRFPPEIKNFTVNKDKINEGEQQKQSRESTI